MLPSIVLWLHRNDLKLVESWDEISEAIEELGFIITDKLKLKRAIQKLPNQRAYIDSEEVKIMEEIKLKVDKFENSINYLSAKQENVNNEKLRIENEINNTFKTISDNLNNRKVELIKKLNEIANKKNEEIKLRLTEYIQTFNDIKSIKQQNTNLLNRAIELSQLTERKSKVIQNNEKITNLIKENNAKHNVVINDKIHLALDTTNIFKVWH